MLKNNEDKKDGQVENECEALSFDSLGLSEPLLKAIAYHGYKHPSAIQAKAIPLIMNGDDVMAAAQTGTGKTASFALPILESLLTKKQSSQRQTTVLILTPTRELAAQILASLETYGKYVSIRTAVVFGGVNINPQKNKLKNGVEILVATPGRLLDLYRQKAIRFDDLDTFVLDEADRMLDMGFIHDIRKVISLLPKNRQTLLFSATFSNDIRKLAKSIIKNPTEVSVTPRNTAAATIAQAVYNVKKSQKSALLSHLVSQHSWEQVLVFTKTKHGANRLTDYLKEAGLKSMAIHGNKSQSARTKALADFKKNKIRILIATDIASRGLDIDQLPHVVNYDLPYVAEDYVHRIGRTGRAGASGEAISLVSVDEAKLLAAIQRLIKQEIPIKTCNSFKFEKDDKKGSDQRRFFRKRSKKSHSAKFRR